MLIIGLTGATGSGKGVFGKTAKERFGALHIDTDRTAREVAEPGRPCLADIRAHFGEGVIRSDGTLDRAALAKIVFSDAEKLALLNKLTHHYITDEVRALLKKAEADNVPLAVIDAPLLFESGENAICDVTVGVIADEKTRLARIMQRDGITEDAAKKRIASGKTAGFFRENCDYILENNSDSENGFRRQVETLLTELLDGHRAAAQRGAGKL